MKHFIFVISGFLKLYRNLVDQPGFLLEENHEKLVVDFQARNIRPDRNLVQVFGKLEFLGLLFVVVEGGGLP